MSAFTKFGGNTSPRATGKGLDLTTDIDKEKVRLLPDANGSGERWHDEMEGGDEDEN